MEKYPHPYWKHFRHGAFSRGMASVGVGCIAMFAAFPSTSMEAAFGRLHKNGAGVFGAGSILVESILVDGKAGHIAMQPTPTEGHTPTDGFMPKMLPLGVGVLVHFLT